MTLILKPCQVLVRLFGNKKKMRAVCDQGRSDGGGGGAWGVRDPPLRDFLYFKMSNVQYLGGKKAQI